MVYNICKNISLSLEYIYIYT